MLVLALITGIFGFLGYMYLSTVCWYWVDENVPSDTNPISHYFLKTILCILIAVCVVLTMGIVMFFFDMWKDDNFD